jgi:AraC-like DNA-binding protein
VISSPENPILIPKGTSYTNFCLDDAESFMVNFLADTDVTQIQSLTPQHVSRVEPHYTRLISLSDKALVSPLPFDEECLAISEIYILLSLLAVPQKKRTDTEKLFDNATEFILAQMHNPDLSCSLTASHLNVSEVYLRKLFNKFASMPTGQYIMRVRMERAKLLLTEKVPIKQTAFRVGYSDVYTFTRAYTSYFGFSPGKT